MIEVIVHDIVSRLPHKSTQEDLARLPSNVVLLPSIILLKAQDRGRMLPILVGSCERDAIAVLLSQKPTVRPFMYDLFARVLDASKSTVERVAVTRLHEGLYYAVARLSTADGQVHEVDTRPSDAIIIALRVKAPIFVEEAILDQAGFEANTTDDFLTERQRKDQGEEAARNKDADLDWASLVDIARTA